jgi:hypothetical protein
MQPTLTRAGWLLVGLAGLAVLLAGCGQRGGRQGRGGRAHIQRLALLYGRYAVSHHGRAPANEKEFRAFLHHLSPDDLPKGIDRSDVDGLLTSPRDGQPYGIAYGVAVGGSRPAQALVVVYERAGVDGQHYVAFDSSDVQEVDDTRLRELVTHVHEPRASR